MNQYMTDFLSYIWHRDSIHARFRTMINPVWNLNESFWDVVGYFFGAKFYSCNRARIRPRYICKFNAEYLCMDKLTYEVFRRASMSILSRLAELN